MIYYLYKRMLYLLPILFGVSVIAFSLIHIMPGDPVDSLLGPQATDSNCMSLRRTANTIYLVL
jgi:peptide/nickel transport system permease protein